MSGSWCLVFPKELKELKIGQMYSTLSEVNTGVCQIFDSSGKIGCTSLAIFSPLWYEYMKGECDEKQLAEIQSLKGACVWNGKYVNENSRDLVLVTSIAGRIESVFPKFPLVMIRFN